VVPHFDLGQILDTAVNLIGLFLAVVSQKSDLALFEVNFLDCRCGVHHLNGVYAFVRRP
jgi:hypothetical protein